MGAVLSGWIGGGLVDRRHFLSGLGVSSLGLKGGLGGRADAEASVPNAAPLAPLKIDAVEVLELRGADFREVMVISIRSFGPNDKKSPDSHLISQGKDGDYYGSPVYLFELANDRRDNWTKEDRAVVRQAGNVFVQSLNYKEALPPAGFEVVTAGHHPDRDTVSPTEFCKITRSRYETSHARPNERD